MRRTRFALPTLCLVLLPVTTGGCGLILTHGPPQGHEQMTQFTCTDGNTGPIIDVVVGGLNLVGSIALATDQSYTQEEANQLIAGGVTWGILLGVSAGVGFNKTKKCRAAKQQLAERLQGAPVDTRAADAGVLSVVIRPVRVDTLRAIGQQVQLTATAYSSAGSVVPNKQFTWSSSNDAIASVSAVGLITARSAGEVVIAANTDNVVGTVRIVVAPSR